MNFKFAILISLVVCLVTFQGAVADDWYEDVAEAIKVGAKEEKDLLILYTGSDWCPPCKKLEDEVLSQEDFLKEIRTGYVLVKLDFPKNLIQKAEILKQNNEWQEKFGVDGFPTIVLMDSQQRPYGFTGYEEGGVEGYLGLLEGLRQARIRRDEYLDKAEKAEGHERAKLLDEAMSQLNQEIVSVYYEEFVKEMVELDPEDELGFEDEVE